jgi:hypothetical protein
MKLLVDFFCGGEEGVDGRCAMFVLLKVYVSQGPLFPFFLSPDES